MTYVVIPVIRATSSKSIARLNETTIDSTVLIFALVCTVLTGRLSLALRQHYKTSRAPTCKARSDRSARSVSPEVGDAVTR